MEWELTPKTKKQIQIDSENNLILKDEDRETVEIPFPLWSLISPPPIEEKGQLKNSTTKTIEDQKKNCMLIVSGNTFFCFVIDLAEGRFIDAGLT